MSKSKTEWYKTYTITTFEGVLSINDILEVNNRWITDPRFDKISYYLIDFSKVLKINFNDHDYKMTAIYFNNLTKWGKKYKRFVGFVLPVGEIEEQVNHYLVEMGKLNNPWPRKTFRDLYKAHAWAKSMVRSA